MAQSRFEQVNGQIIGAIRAGVSLGDAGRQADVKLPTIKRWLSLGRHDPGSPYAKFAAAVDEAREYEPPGAMSEQELLEVVSRTARKGSVQAMKLYWEMIRADSDPDEETSADPLAKLDELAERRQRNTA